MIPCRSFPGLCSELNPLHLLSASFSRFGTPQIANPFTLPSLLESLSSVTPAHYCRHLLALIFLNRAPQTNSFFAPFRSSLLSPSTASAGRSGVLVRIWFFLIIRFFFLEIPGLRVLSSLTIPTGRRKGSRCLHDPPPPPLSLPWWLIGS